MYLTGVTVGVNDGSKDALEAARDNDELTMVIVGDLEFTEATTGGVGLAGVIAEIEHEVKEVPEAAEDDEQLIETPAGGAECARGLVDTEDTASKTPEDVEFEKSDAGDSIEGVVKVAEGGVEFAEGDADTGDVTSNTPDGERSDSGDPVEDLAKAAKGGGVVMEHPLGSMVLTYSSKPRRCRIHRG